ncbi:hypothetical protein D3C85_473980 [compost metagenome]
MKKPGFILFAICLILFSCSNDDDSARNKEQRNLDKMYQEIVSVSLVNSQVCTDSNEWDFTAIGSKSCGGSNGYIIFSKKIDKTAFLAKVKAYTDAQAAFNVKWNVFSNCDMILPPSSVDCVDGKPKLLYLTLF